MGKQPTKVDKIPQGYEFSHKDEVTGRDIYKKTSTTPGSKTKVTTAISKPAASGTPKILRPPLPRKKNPTIEEDFVYIEPTAPIVPAIQAPTNTKIPLFEDTRIDRKLQPPINPNIDFYQYPDPNAGYSKSTPMYFDKTTQRPVDVLKSIGSDGTYNPVYTDTLTANEGKYQGTIKQGNPRVTTEPDKTNILPGNEIDKSGTKKGEIVGTTGFKKGGLVQKLAEGGEIAGYNYQGEPVDMYGKVIVNKGMTSNEVGKQSLELGVNSLNGILGSLNKSKSTDTTTNPQANPTENPTQATTSAGGKSALYGGLANLGAGAAGIGAAYVDSKNKDAMGRYTSKDAAMGSSTLKGAAIGAKLGANPMLAGATGGASILVGAGAGALGGLAYGAVRGKKDVNKIAESAAKRKDELNSANTKSIQEQAVLNRDNGDFNAILTKPYTEKNTNYDEEDNLITRFNKGGVVGKVKQMCAKGGVIKGEGGPKDDKIEAKIKPGSFVVPAENTKVAETLREKLLMKAPKMKADLNQKGGEDVMLSNGEHLFTPEEKHELIEKGVNIDALAPESKVKAMEKKSHIMFPSFAEGGEVAEDTVDPVKELAKIEAERKAVAKEKAKRESYNEIRQAERAKLYDKYNKEEERKSKAKEWEKKYNDAKTKLDALNKAYESYSKESSVPMSKTDRLIGMQSIKTPESIRIRKESILKDIKDAQSEYDNAKRTYDYVSSGKTYIAPKDNANKATTTSSATSTTNPIETKPAIKVPKTGYVPKVATKTSPNNKFTVTANPDEEVIVPNGNLSPNEMTAKINADDKAATDAKLLNDSTVTPNVTLNDVTNNGQSNRVNGLLGRLGNVDPTAAVGLGQAFLGNRMLKKVQRPTWNNEIDPIYNETVNRANQQAKFGLSPEEMFLAKQDQQNALNDARFSARVNSGGSAGNAFNQERGAINDAWKAKLGLRVADTDLRMQKQLYADQLAKERAGILANNRRTAFGDAMNEFNQKQQAGSELISAGLSNTIGAYRFNKDLQAQKEANLASNAWTRQYGQNM